MKSSEKGFGVLPVLLIVVVIATVGFVGYKVVGKKSNNTQKNVNTATQKDATTNQPEDSQDNSAKSLPKSTTQVVTYKGAKYSLVLPEGWTYKDVPVLGDENLSYFIDPAKRVQLEAQIIKRPQTAGEASASGPMDASHPFTGINNSKYFLAGYTGSSKQAGKYELLQISADCQPWHCYTPINNEYSLNLGIRSSDGTTPISIDDPLVKDIQNIIATIKLN